MSVLIKERSDQLLTSDNVYFNIDIELFSKINGVNQLYPGVAFFFFFLLIVYFSPIDMPERYTKIKGRYYKNDPAKEQKISKKKCFPRSSNSFSHSIHNFSVLNI